MAKPKVTAPPVTKPQFCVSKVRDIAEVKACNIKMKSHPIIGYVCPNKDNHLYPMMTGFCKSGWHEGTKARSASGQPAPPCKFYINCPCDCHAKINRMFEMTGDERVLLDVSDFKIENPYVMPTLEPLSAVPSNPGATVAAPVVESPAPGIVPASLPRTFDPTTTGRAARGELEAWVRKVTDVWAVEQDAVCSVGYLSREIGRTLGINPPSQGAIQNVLLRWKELGFAQIETERPLRFLGYTEDGIKYGLENMKARAKRVINK